jgi:hypothetical protein
MKKKQTKERGEWENWIDVVVVCHIAQAGKVISR